MSKNTWLRYNRNSEMVEVIIRDGSGAKIETWKCSTKDEKTKAKIMNLLISKYGFKPTIPERKNDNKDLDWLQKGSW